MVMRMRKMQNFSNFLCGGDQLLEMSNVFSCVSRVIKYKVIKGERKRAQPYSVRLQGSAT